MPCPIILWIWYVSVSVLLRYYFTIYCKDIFAVIHEDLRTYSKMGLAIAAILFYMIHSKRNSWLHLHAWELVVVGVIGAPGLFMEGMTLFVCFFLWSGWRHNFVGEPEFPSRYLNWVGLLDFWCPVRRPFIGNK